MLESQETISSNDYNEKADVFIGCLHTVLVTCVCPIHVLCLAARP